MNLDELEKLAKAAKDSAYMDCTQELDCNCIQCLYDNAANPETILKLVAVAKAATRLGQYDCYPGDECVLGTERKILEKALEDLNVTQD